MFLESLWGIRPWPCRFAHAGRVSAARGFFGCSGSSEGFEGLPDSGAGVSACHGSCLSDWFPPNTPARLRSGGPAYWVLMIVLEDKLEGDLDLPSAGCAIVLSDLRLRDSERRRGDAKV